MDLDDDHETLEAALALIDEWELEFSGDADLGPSVGTSSASPAPTTSSDGGDTASDSPSSPSPTHSPVPGTDPSPKATSYPSSGSRRRRACSGDDQPVDSQTKQRSRREELVFLRRRVRELDNQLASLRAAAEEEEPNKSTTSTRDQQLDASWVWQQIASRQLEYRQRSEHENIKLRVQVEEQVRIAKDLMRVLLRAYRRDDEAKAITHDEDGQRIKRVKLPTSGRIEMSEEAQIQRTDELFQERDAIFSMAPFARGSPVLRDIRLMEHDNGEMTINVDSSWVLPFAVDQVASAFWTFLVRKSERRIDELSEADLVDDKRNLLVTKYESNATANRLVGTFRGQFVARRVRPVEAQEPAYVLWNLWSNPVNFKPMSMEGVCIQNESIMKIAWADQLAGQPAPATNDGRMCVVQICQRVHVRLAAAETPTRRRRVGALTEFMMYTIESELQWKQAVLESLLLRSVVPSAPADAPAWSYSSLAVQAHSDLHSTAH